MITAGDRIDAMSSRHHDVVVMETTETGRPVIACIADGSSGRAVARIAATLARRLEAGLLLTTVQQPTPGTASNDDGRSLLDSAARGLDQAGEMRVACGEPAERLLAVTAREAAQLIVVSTPRPSPVRTPVLGNVYLALASAAPCPVVVVPPRVSAMNADGPIVCGVDGSAPARAAARIAGDLADRLQARLLLVHFEHGPAADRLVTVAERLGAEVLVTGSRGHGRVALGSVASRLAVAATRPVIVVPAGAPV